MDSGTSPPDNDIHMSINIRPRRLPRADFHLGLVQRAKLDRAEGEKVD